MIQKLSIVLLAMIALSACSSSTLPAGQAAYAIIPPPALGSNKPAYKIGTLDVLKITVFQEEDLTQDEVSVDSSGNIVMPLIGLVQAEGATTAQLAKSIADRLEERFLVDPQVSIAILKSASLKLTIEGSVKKPGVYDVEGTTTLLQAMALAEGPTQTARTDQILVFRSINNEVYGAQFNLKEIRKGQEPNPELLGGDIVVVGFSGLKGVYRDFLTIAPLLTSVFVQIVR
ncbi:MAG: polysaccharide biosynthesis protein GumB [Sphingopyxis sp.]|nr:MAG: polysaccharide biosynthesis protein GumB [Sphingopyxis sp.]